MAATTPHAVTITAPSLHAARVAAVPPPAPPPRWRSPLGCGSFCALSANLPHAVVYDVMLGVFVTVSLILLCSLLVVLLCDDTPDAMMLLLVPAYVGSRGTKLGASFLHLILACADMVALPPRWDWATHGYRGVPTAVLWTRFVEHLGALLSTTALVTSTNGFTSSVVLGPPHVIAAVLVLPLLVGAGIEVVVLTSLMFLPLGLASAGVTQRSLAWRKRAVRNVWGACIMRGPPLLSTVLLFPLIASLLAPFAGTPTTLTTSGVAVPDPTILASGLQWLAGIITCVIAPLSVVAVLDACALWCRAVSRTRSAPRPHGTSKLATGVLAEALSKRLHGAAREAETQARLDAAVGGLTASLGGGLLVCGALLVLVLLRLSVYVVSTATNAGVSEVPALPAPLAGWTVPDSGALAWVGVPWMALCACILVGSLVLLQCVLPRVRTHHTQLKLQARVSRLLAKLAPLPHWGALCDPAHNGRVRGLTPAEAVALAEAVGGGGTGSGAGLAAASLHPVTAKGSSTSTEEGATPLLSQRCAICLTAPVALTLWPCGHTLCRACALALLSKAVDDAARSLARTAGLTEASTEGDARDGRRPSVLPDQLAVCHMCRGGVTGVMKMGPLARLEWAGGVCIVVPLE